MISLSRLTALLFVAASHALRCAVFVIRVIIAQVPTIVIIIPVPNGTL